MKKITKLGMGLATAGVLILNSVSSAYASTTVSLCTTGADGTNTGFSSLCTLTFSAALPNIINLLLVVAFVIALLFLIYGGIRWILSGGDKEGTAKAKGTVTAALIGLAIVLSSWILINVILNFFGVGGTGFNITDINGETIPSKVVQ